MKLVVKLQAFTMGKMNISFTQNLQMDTKITHNN